MRSLRFSAALTVFFVTIFPVFIGAIIGGIFFIYHIVSHLGGDLNSGFALNTWLLTIFHSLTMYAIPCFVVGIALMFLLDRGIPHAKFKLASLVIALIMTLWAYSTVDYKVLTPVIIVFVASALGSYGLLHWISVPSEQRKVPPVFDGLTK